MFELDIVFFGTHTRLCCDGKCNKAWGMNTRPKVYLADDDDLDDYYYVPDDELGEAPEHPGTVEGWHRKPVGATSAKDMNKWCARECERSNMFEYHEVVKLPDFSRRNYNSHERQREYDKQFV